MDTTGWIGTKSRKKTKRTGEKAGEKKTKGKSYLPDDIIPNILCRLPAKNASQCRLVCKGWRDLTLSREFVDLNFRHSLPMLLVKNPSSMNHMLRWRWDHFLLDKWRERALSKSMIHTFPFDHYEDLEYVAEFSHAGLIVFREKTYLQDVIILNPMFLEKVRITIPMNLSQSEIYGVFFHPMLREYCSLWGMKDPPLGLRSRLHPPYSRSPPKPKPIMYKIIIFGSIPFTKTICNPFPHRFKRRCCYPLFIDKYLYWMLEGGRHDIMQFDIISEEFTVKPCPVPVETEYNPDHTHLLNIEGALSFLVIFPRKITIWRLKDHAEQLWTAANYTFNIEKFEWIPTPIAVVDGNLALLSRRRLLVYNLMHGTMSYFRKKYHENVLFLSHQMSLASLKNCQSSICLDGRGDAYVKENIPSTSFEKASPDEQEDEKSENSWTSQSLTVSSNSLDSEESMMTFEVSSNEEEDSS